MDALGRFGPVADAWAVDREVRWARRAARRPRYWPVLGRPGGLISDSVTASSARPQRSSTLA
ncbi:hypothetical protein SFUMM280S_06231 [Streptomyces fumanus]